MTRGTDGPAERGIALISVVVLLVVLTGSSLVLVWFMNQQQARAGLRYRSTVALALAEAGVHKALSILESVAPDGSGPGHAWRPTGYSELASTGAFEGRLTLALADEPGGTILITSVGKVAGVIRRVRARVLLASPTLQAALYGMSVVRFERPPAATLILPYAAGSGDRPWVHIAAGKGVLLATTDVMLNRTARTVEVAPGPVDAPANGGTVATQRLGPIRFMLARGAELMVGQEHQRIDVQQLRIMGLPIEDVIERIGALPQVPEVDRAFFKAQATANTGNAGLNEAAGQYHGDRDLNRKRDSLYTPAQFGRLQSYMSSGGGPSQLTGVIYVTGGVALIGRQALQIVEGALVTEGTVEISQGASMEITHSAVTRSLPGLIVLDRGALTVTDEARLRVHGLVYANRVVALGRGARVDIVGGVLGNDPVLSFRNFGAEVVIRYDHAILGTPGLRVPAGTIPIAWVTAWAE